MNNKFHNIDIMSSCTTDPQVMLGNALANRNLEDFRIALELGADPNLLDKQQRSIYEKALSTYGCADFVAECLKRYSKANYVNSHLNKGAINYAADSKDPRILGVLLRYPDVDIDHKFYQLTALNYLAKNITNDLVNDMTECIKFLLKHQASPNIPDNRDMTPLNYILRNKTLENHKKTELVEEFLALPNLDIDTYRDGEARNLLLRDFPDFKLPITNSNFICNFETMLALIKAGDGVKFQQQFTTFQSNLSDRENFTTEQLLILLIESIKRGNHTALDLMLSVNELNINQQYNGATALKVATVWGNWYALDKLLQHPEVKLQPDYNPLITVIQNLNEDPTEVYTDYHKCFRILLDSEKVDINAGDSSGSSPLHYAVRYRYPEAIKELLNRGAYIGSKNKFNELPINELDAEILEEHFDNCISTNNLKAGDENFEIHMNYMNLLSEISNEKQTLGTKIHAEMTPITFIAKSKEHRYLLQHPLITSFLFLKWHRLSAIFYINFFLYVFFAVSIITHTMLKFRESEYTTLTGTFGICSWIGIGYMLLRECLQMLISPGRYITSPINLMEILLITSSIMTCIEPTYDKQTQRVLAVLTILMIAIELCLLVGSLPVLSISTHMLMLQAVCSSFLKSFTLYSIFVVTFSLCFYILFGKPEAMDVNGNDTNEESVDFNKFSNPLTAVIKTIVMLTGEFDAGDLEFDTLYSYLLFLLFVILMSIVLFNLLNGLAVSDTQAIKGQAELNGAICRTKVLSRYEDVIISRNKHSSVIASLQCFRWISHYIMNLYPNYIAGKQIAVLPNDNNKVLISTLVTTNDEIGIKKFSNSKTVKRDFMLLNSESGTNENGRKELRILGPPIRFIFCCCSPINGKCSEMDGRTVKLALAVIEKKAKLLKERNQSQYLEKRLENIELKLNRVFELLNDLPNKHI